MMYVLSVYRDAWDRLYMSRIYEEKDYELNMIFLIIPGLLLTTLCNYFVFRNNYEKLKDLQQ
jgi:hypothetical protein